MANTTNMYTRTFNAARLAQGFRSQAHLDAFFAVSVHVASCAECAARDGYVELDDGIQPTSGRCPEAQRLEALVSQADRAPVAPVDTRPRSSYQLPNGETVRVIRDHGETPKPVITYQLKGGAVVEATLLPEPHGAS